MTNAVYHITPFTLLDYPNKTACIIWFAGCNMRCHYCYNPEIVRGKGRIAFEEAFNWICSRKGFLDGVVFSGGECLMHKRIESFISDIKQQGFLVKVDTNGSHPQRLKTLVQNQLINYVALDFKALPHNFYQLTQSDLFVKFQQSLDFLIQSKIQFEVRTTVHSNLLKPDDIKQMIRYLEIKNYTGSYFLQNFFNNCTTLGELPNDYCKVQTGDFISSNFEIVVRS
ncbi:MAG: anaerobic ribonucleoside-triphosphate reductase activating protein [Saprospiraceae bacterium]|nr:anaerobic ribonucleoside-triphosphate reductase activating protein [Saprospiraceae bacterium]HRG67465.1 anaerobic ribonucleoside-triphosphate reductase activating protein [Saprospiraceae bacterium]